MPHDPVRDLESAKVALPGLAKQCSEPSPTLVHLMSLSSKLRSTIHCLSSLIEGAALDGRRTGGSSNRAAEALLLLEHYRELEEGVAKTFEAQQDLIAKREAAEIDANGSTRRALRAARALHVALRSQQAPPSDDTARAGAGIEASRADFDAAWAVAFDLPVVSRPPSAPPAPSAAPHADTRSGSAPAEDGWGDGGIDDSGWGDLDLGADDGTRGGIEGRPRAAVGSGVAAAAPAPPPPTYDAAEARRLRDLYVASALAEFRSRASSSAAAAAAPKPATPAFTIEAPPDDSEAPVAGPVASAVAALRRDNTASPRSAFGTPTRRAAAAAAAGAAAGGAAAVRPTATIASALAGSGGLRPSKTQASAFSVSSSSAHAPVLLPRDVEAAAAAAALPRLQFPVAYRRRRQLPPPRSHREAVGATPAAARGSSRAALATLASPSAGSQAAELPPSPRRVLEPSLASARDLLFPDAAADAREGAAAAGEAEEDLSAQLLELLAEMKARSLEVLSRLRSDNAALDSTAEAVEANLDAVGGANERLAEQLGASMGGICSSMALLVAAALAFFVAYAVMRVSWAPPAWTLTGRYQLLVAAFRWLRDACALLSDAGGPVARAVLAGVKGWHGGGASGGLGEVGDGDEADEL